MGQSVAASFLKLNPLARILDSRTATIHRVSLDSQYSTLAEELFADTAIRHEWVGPHRRPRTGGHSGQGPLRRVGRPGVINGARLSEH